MTLVLVSGVLAVGRRRRTLVLAVVLVAPALIARWFNLFWGDSVPVEFYLVPALVFISFVILQLILFISLHGSIRKSCAPGSRAICCWELSGCSLTSWWRGCSR